MWGNCWCISKQDNWLPKNCLPPSPYDHICEGSLGFGHKDLKSHTSSVLYMYFHIHCGGYGALIQGAMFTVASPGTGINFKPGVSYRTWYTFQIQHGLDRVNCCVQIHVDHRNRIIGCLKNCLPPFFPMWNWIRPYPRKQFEGTNMLLGVSVWF